MKYVSFDGVTVRDNGQASAANVKDGIEAGFAGGGSLVGLTVRDCRIGNPEATDHQRYGVIARSVVTDVMIVNNEFGLNGTGPVSDSSIGTRIRRDNRGWVTSKVGRTSVADGGTIAHGLSATPTAYGATATTADEYVAITAVSSTTLTVAITKHDGTPGTTANVAWWAEVV